MNHTKGKMRNQIAHVTPISNHDIEEMRLSIKKGGLEYGERVFVENVAKNFEIAFKGEATDTELVDAIEKKIKRRKK